MAPEPRRQNPQSQPLTTTLAKICNSYPAGAGVLRELLQNADDAGASKIEFILDTTSHQTSPLLVDGLAEYQGPALLAYNDSTFSETDWKSISSIGDSEKLKDKLATGKYGIGFNSIYNWTDSPSVLSRTTLLLLDPHHSWSSVFNPPGGPDYDFTVHADDEAMKNQLDSFSCVNNSWSTPFDGTIIRIPLRNAKQAKITKIRQMETTTADIHNTMKTFAEEMGTFGLLFLKSIRKIVFRVDNVCENIVEILSDSDLAKICLEQLVMRERSNAGCQSKSNHLQGSYGQRIYHEAVVRRESLGKTSNTRYGIFHLIGYPDNVDPELMTWAEGDKLFSWVGVALGLNSPSDKPESGKLFSVLPLSVATDLKVHIHGLFSLAADRSRLHDLKSSKATDKRPERWNQFLFDCMIPDAWAMLYSHICYNHPERYFQFYEEETQSKILPWHDINSNVLDVVCQKHLNVWPSFSAYVNAEQAIFAAHNMDPHLKQAMEALSVFAVVVEDNMFQLVKTKLPHRLLSQRLLFDSVKSKSQWPWLSEETNSALLQYLFPCFQTEELAHLPIFPFENGVYRPLSMKAFLHRDVLEKELFEKGQDINLDISRIPSIVCKAMHSRVGKDTLIRYRSAKDLREYCFQHIAANDADVISSNPEVEIFVRKTWQWINTHTLNLKEVYALWLVPLENGGFRRLVPQGSLVATFFNGGGPHEIARYLMGCRPNLAQQIVSNRWFDDSAERQPVSFANDRAFLLRDGRSFLGFAEFLDEFAEILATLPEEKLADCHRVLKEMFSDRSAKEKNILKGITMFPEVLWGNRNGMQPPSRKLVNLSGSKIYHGLKTLIPLPRLEGQGFLDATNDETLKLLTKTGIISCYKETAIIEKHVIPAAKAGFYRNLAPDYRLIVAQKVFQNFYKLSQSAQALVPKLPIVPKARTTPLEFASCEDMIDPRPPNEILQNLFFDGEVFWPDASFLAGYSAILKECGLVEVLNESIASQRIRVYAKFADDVSSVETRVKSMLSMNIVHGQVPSTNFVKLARSLQWLPARKLNEELSLYTADECRDSSWKAVAGHVMPIMPYKIHQSWENVFNWPDLSSDLLISQLQESVVHREWSSISATLGQLSGHDIAKHVDFLRRLDFVRSSENTLINPSIACRRNAEKLFPFVANVDGFFWNKHQKLLELVGIPEFPDLPRLITVQNALMTAGELTDANIDIAIALATLWSSISSDVSELRLPDTAGLLHLLRDLVFNDLPFPTNCGRPRVHSKVSPSLATSLGIEPISVLVEKQELCIADEEDEFEQLEDVTDGIKDTLGRYSLESTFPEYIANADDCGSATELNIMFDGNAYEYDNLLTPEMAKWQGAALIIHNDGVFTEADFDGFKHVGRGSKRDDPDTIGKFGRGSQTMFHWTDVPMILSGDFLVILDPLRKHLPYNYRKKQRKLGVKISLEKLRSNCPSQLAPFEGLWGFDSAQKRYQGTIFRFPLRSMTENSDLLETTHIRDASFTRGICEKFFAEAQISLLFIKNIQLVNYSLRANKHENASTSALQWSVRRGKWPDPESSSELAEVLVCQYDSLHQKTEITQNYWRCILDLDEWSGKLQHRHKRTMKYIECGVAALVPQEASSSALGAVHHKFFNSLPLKFNSTLPLHVHGTFLLSGDRQNISTESTSEESGSEWNMWLLKEEIPKVYYLLLEDLGKRIGETIYDFFPEASSYNHDHLSRIVAAAFWDKLSSMSNRIFPVVKAEVAPTPVLRGKQKRTPRKTYSLIESQRAMLDLLNVTESAALQSLLSNCQADFVKPPRHIARILQNVKGLKIVTATVVRNLLKGDGASKIVEDLRVGHENHFNTLLKFVAPHNEDDLAEFDGCNILPLADGKIGRLFLKSKPRGSISVPTYFLATEDDLKIFSFASSFLTVDKDEWLIAKILKSDQFNLKAFDKWDAPFLLKFRDDWVMNDKNKKWTYALWRYMGLSLDEDQTTPPTYDFLSDFPLLILEDTNGVESFVSLKSFELGPAVIRPDEDEQRRMVKSIPGMRMADPMAAPKGIQKETNLVNSNSISRLIKGMKHLAEQNGQSLEKFTISCLDDQYRKNLRDILHKLYQYIHPLRDLCYELPICISFAEKRALLTPARALSTENSSLVQPFMKNYELFTTDQIFLPKQSILSTKSLLQNYILGSLPKTLPLSGDRYNYVKFLEALCKDNIIRKDWKGFYPPLKTSALAPRQDGTLCLASSLYDQREPVFAAAFADKATTSFLLEDAQHYPMSDFWKNLEIRGRHPNTKGDWFLQSRDYLNCLRELQSLTTLTDDNALIRINEVLSPLRTEKNTLLNVDDTTWRSFAEMALFPLTGDNIDNQPHFRQERMRDLAASCRFQPLKGVVPKEYVAICWSQVPFVNPEPAKWVLTQCRGTDRPFLTTVWKHLNFLSECASKVMECDKENFLQDLDRTYESLQSALPKSATLQIPKGAIWFNVEDRGAVSLEDLRSSWARLEHLFLESPCLAPPHQTVGRYLAKYSALLEDAGCQKIFKPDIQPIQSQISWSNPLIYQTLRENYGAVDVTFEAKHEIGTGSSANSEYRAISAHSLVLATRSEYCLRRFYGTWAKTKKERVELIRFEALEVMINFCYSCHEAWFESVRVDGNQSIGELADRLDSLLAVLAGADMWIMPALHSLVQEAIIAGIWYFVRPDNVKMVLEEAERSHGDRIVDLCKKYVAGNERAIKLAKKIDPEPEQ